MPYLRQHKERFFTPCENLQYLLSLVGVMKANIQEEWFAFKNHFVNSLWGQFMWVLAENFYAQSAYILKSCTEPANLSVTQVLKFSL